MALLLALPALASFAAEAPKNGQAVIVGKSGAVTARSYEGPLHEGGPSKTTALAEGYAVGELTTISTDAGGSACVLLSPGAILCLGGGTEIEIKRLRHAADGLPSSEDDLVREIELTVTKGRVFMHAGDPEFKLAMKINFGPLSVQAPRGSFAVASDGDDWVVFNEEGDLDIVDAEGRSVSYPPGTNMRAASGPEGTLTLGEDQALASSPLRAFELCYEFIPDLEPFFKETEQGLDLTSLTEYLDTSEPVTFLGFDIIVNDVSTSVR